MGTRFTPAQFEYYRQSLALVKLSPHSTLVTISFNPAALSLVVSDGITKWVIGLGSTSREAMHTKEEEE